jgi:hypothetical protein
MSNADWYAKKLGSQKPPSPAPQTSPNPMLPYRQAQQAPNVPVAYDQKNDQVVVKAQSALNPENCPGCFSGNYFAPLGTQRKRCYDCGYPIVQAGTGVGGTGNGGTPIAAKQVGQSGGFNPTTIVGRLE